MRRIVSRHRIATATITLLFLLSGSAILLYPRIARAFTLVTATIYFDPISVTSDQTLHVHLVNQLGASPYGFFTTCKPTTPGLGTAASGAAITLAVGDGSDESFPFAAFAPTVGTTRIPVVCKVAVLVLPPPSPIPGDFSGRIASSIEIIDDKTGRPTQILASRHIVLPTTGPCVSCN
jgi:hypothetical protein